MREEISVAPQAVNQSQETVCDLSPADSVMTRTAAWRVTTEGDCEERQKKGTCLHLVI